MIDPSYFVGTRCPACDAGTLVIPSPITIIPPHLPPPVLECCECRELFSFAQESDLYDSQT